VHEARRAHRETILVPGELRPDQIYRLAYRMAAAADHAKAEAILGRALRRLARRRERQGVHPAMIAVERRAREAIARRRDRPHDAVADGRGLRRGVMPIAWNAEKPRSADLERGFLRRGAPTITVPCDRPWNGQPAPGFRYTVASRRRDAGLPSRARLHPRSEAALPRDAKLKAQRGFPSRGEGARGRVARAGDWDLGRGAALRGPPAP
jgi:hypothetical protein